MSIVRIFIFVAFIVIAGCGKKSNQSWQVYLDQSGTYSSPRVTDLNKDGIGDIVIGAGGREDHPSDSAVIAIDGNSGKILWAVAADNQLVGSAIFRDVSNDDIPDVFIGGRWAELYAINGANGEVIWKFFPGRKTADPSADGWYNFTSPQFIPDQDKDGIEDLLIANGGNARAAPHDPNRPAGRLLVLSSRTGRILANVLTPDGRETYMSVVTTAPDKQGNCVVYFGTGGETLGGHFYRSSISDIMNGHIANAKVLASARHKGFIAPPVLTDISGDGISDIIINAVEGSMLAINGATDSLIWEVQFPGTEAYTTAAVGYFNEDRIPDFFCNFAIGIFPNLPKSIRFMVDGRTGTREYLDTIRAFQYASAIAADLDGDGFDEAIVNQSDLKRKQFENIYFSYLLAFDFKRKNKIPIGDTVLATNFASTPWIGDVDNDNRFDIIHASVNFNDIRFTLERPLGLFVKRYNTGIAIKHSPKWGAYMGSRYNGNYD
jgi:outer membrane protein assembly factor BamB